MSSIATPLRRQLENAIKKARKIAEGGARHALEALAVHEPDPYQHMDDAQRTLRRQLRAQAKQLGDGESPIKRGAYEIKHLAEKLAYDQWHRLLFARYLLENSLLISPEHGVSVSLDDCEELSTSLGLKDAWAVAARFAANELPEIFRADDPVGAVELSVNDRKPLIQLVTELSVDVFTASDTLGWCYQFWQAEKKEEVNDTGNKVGADELPAVTQLFTEDYMVDFLLDNTLGAWHAGKILGTKPTLAATALSEDELRDAASLPGCSWKYLRFIKGKDDKWTPAAGAFEGWPKAAKELKCLDPCMGSGHFVVAMFERLVALRIAEEILDELDSVTAVIRDNLFGLEIDPRCTQIGAFNLALAAWRRVGHCALPAMNVACAGLAPNARKEDWLHLTGDDERLQRGMTRLHALFKDAPVLGSLINPRATSGDLLEADFHELQPLLEKALVQEAQDDNVHEMAVTARGLAKAAEILAGQFTLVSTNVPYLKRGNQDEPLLSYCKAHFADACACLSTTFIERCISFCKPGGTFTAVTPQPWLFLQSYKDFRKNVLEEHEWNILARLGHSAFETISGHVVDVVLLTLSAQGDKRLGWFVDCDLCTTAKEKAVELVAGDLVIFDQAEQLKHPESRVVFGEIASGQLINYFARSVHGQGSFDDPSFVRQFWELPHILDGWIFQQTSSNSNALDVGLENIFLWEEGSGRLASLMGIKAEDGYTTGKWKAGQSAWGKNGIAVSGMGNLYVNRYSGGSFDTNVAVIYSENKDIFLPLWCYCMSPEFIENVRKIDRKPKVTPNTFAKVPFDLAMWQQVAEEKYPHGLPKPFSSDPTQWIFNGYPKDSDQPLHVGLARLLGYQWPRQVGSSFPDCPALGQDGLENKADEDGIVCLSATKGEAPAAERLRGLLVQALGEFDLSAIISSAGLKGSKSENLEEWLRDEFFEQHCALFHHRPFIWHVWDGHKSGFSALVNYHKLDHAGLEKLTYAYLGDWIRRQQAAVEAGDAGSDARLQSAKLLQVKLKLILEGEPPYDLFVRWKPLSQQAIGWHPDINDGVRMNIRPFLAQDIPGGKKGAGILRTKPNIKWDKDRGKEPARDKKEFPWFWGWDEQKQDFAGIGKESDGNRWNDCHYTNEFKRKAKGADS